MSQTGKTPAAQKGQRVALVMAGVGVFWMVATFLGSELGLSLRIRALFDLMALAGFGFALWLTFTLWRDRRNDDSKR